MSTETLHPARTPWVRETFPATHRKLEVTPVGDGLWRVSRADRMILGHISRPLGTNAADTRYVVRKALAGVIRQINYGEFSSADDALNAFG